MTDARERMARAIQEAARTEDVCPGSHIVFDARSAAYFADAALAVARKLVKDAVPHSKGDGLTAVDTLAWNMARAAALRALGGEL